MRKVLIIDDEAAFGRLISEYIVRAGFEAHWTQTAEDAQARLIKQKFDCILLDMSLQTGSGEQLLDLIRDDKLSINHTTSVFVISGYLNTALVNRLKPKVNEIFQKPFDFNLLVTKMYLLFPDMRSSNESISRVATREIQDPQNFDTSTERHFLHTLANFIAIADGSLDIAFEKLAPLCTQEQQALSMLYEALKAVHQAANLLESRRESIKHQKTV